MVKFAIIGVLVAVTGALGYFGERFLRPTEAPGPAPKEMAAKAPTKELLFKLPLGKFTMQVMQPRATQHIVFDIDVYVMGAKNFEEINGAVGRAKLRDTMVSVVADLAETDRPLLTMEDQEALKGELANQLVRKLYVQFPVIRSARINSFHRNSSLRD